MKYTVVKNAAIKGRFYLAGATVELVEAAARKYLERGLIAPFEDGEAKTPPEGIAEQVETIDLALGAKQKPANKLRGGASNRKPAKPVEKSK